MIPPNTVPVVSIIVPTYNREGYIERTICSVKSQTFEDYEIIVVDDASIDNTVDVVKNAAKSERRIKLIQSERNGGVSAARNLGLKSATGKYVLFLDSDDEVYETAIDKLIIKGNITEADFVIGKHFNQRNGSDPEIDAIYRNEVVQNTLLIEAICNNYHFCLASILFRREFLERNSIYFDESLRAGSDKLQLIVALKRAKNFYLIDERILKVNKDTSNSITQQHKELWHKLVYVKGRWKIFIVTIELLNFRITLLSIKQLIISLKRLVYHFI